MAGGVSGFSGDPGAGLSPSQQSWQAAGGAPETQRASGHSAQARDVGGQSGRARDGSAGESPAGERESAGATPSSPVTPADSRLLKKSLALLAPQSEKAMAYFFATLFVHNPEMRPMFP